MSHQAHLVWFVPYVILYLLVRGWKYDAIHLSDLVLGIFGWIGKLVLRKKVFITIHGLDFTFEDSKTVLGWIYRIYMTMIRTLPTYDALFSNSEHTKFLAEQHSLQHIIAIPLGISLPEGGVSTRDELQKLYPPFAPDSVYLLTVGRLVKRKGISWFIESVMPELPSSTMLLIAGAVNWRSGDQEPEDVCRAIHRHRLSSRVLLLGPVSDECLRILFANCDVFVMPNIPVEQDVEGFGIVAGEAALSGMPVVASDLEGIPEAIRHQQNGLLMPPRDASAWIATLSELIGRPDVRMELGARAREYTKEHYSWETVVSRYAEAMNNNGKNSR
ncbi:MAG: glycosyltransferase family 4 protein [Candidatus Kerfeldbacteria bacterium]|nr:glycosyltransferase family 4 protein [Candidatus Kerfeldbacteria bacterium]